MVGAAQRSRGYRIPHLELHGRWWPGGRQDGHSQHAPRPQTAGAEWICLLFGGCWLVVDELARSKAYNPVVRQIGCILRTINFRSTSNCTLDGLNQPTLHGR